MDIYYIIAIALLAILYTGIQLYRAFTSRSSRILLGFIYGLVLVTLAIVYLDISTVFVDGFGRSNLRTNWLMGIGFGIALSLLTLAVCFLFIDGLHFLQHRSRKQSKDNPRLRNRRRVLQQLGLGLATLPFAGILYGMWKGKYNYQVRRLELSFPDLPLGFDGFRLLQFSDLHTGSFDNFKAVSEGLALITKEDADLILFTGDWINNFADELDPYMPLLTQLSARYGKYAVLGNHDYSEREEWNTSAAYENNLQQLMTKVDQMGFHQLNNSSTLIRKGADAIRLVGVENWGHPPYPQRGDLWKATELCQDKEFTVLLSHDPTHWEEKVLVHPKFFHLTLSGHTHGSQIGIENRWFKWAPIQYAYRRWAGLYQEAQQYLYVNRGMGFIGYAGRLGIPPEITVITLRKAI